MKIERLRFDLSRDGAIVIYEDGNAVSMTIAEALSAWQESRKQKGLATPLSGVSSIDELLSLLASLSQRQQNRGEQRRD